MDRVRVPVMKMSKRIGILPLLLPVMLALTSCSTVGQHQSATAVAGGIAAPQHKIVTQHKVVKSHHHTQITSSHKQKYQPKPVQVAKYEQKSMIVTMPQVKPAKPVKPVTTSKSTSQPQNKSFPVLYTFASPVSAKQWLLNVQGIDVNLGSYKNTSGRKAIAANIKRLDQIDGNHHYIQAARWDGDHVSQSYVNAIEAEYMAMIGMSILDSGYLETNFGTTIMILGGNGHIIDIPGHRFELIVIRATKVKEVKQKVKPVKAKHTRASLFDNYNFTIGENEVVNVLDAKLNQIVEAAPEVNIAAPSATVSTEMLANPEQRISMHCESTDISLFDQTLCSVNEANNNDTAIRIGQDIKQFCQNEVSTAPAAMVAIDFGSHTLTANND